MGWIVHRMVEHAGLDVTHHKTRGRSLAGGECSSSSNQGECSSTPSSTLQYHDNSSLVQASPTPAYELVAQIARDRFCESRLRNEDVNEVATAVNRLAFGELPIQHAYRLADFLAGQRHLFPNGLDVAGLKQLDIVVTGMFVNAAKCRNGHIDEEKFLEGVNTAKEPLAKKFKFNEKEVSNFMNLILQMPGFERNSWLFRSAMRSRIVAEMNQRLALVEMNQTYQLPGQVIDLIRELAGLFVFRVMGNCNRP